MVRPVQSSISAPSIPFQPTTVNPLYKDQFGVNTLTEGVTSRKFFIVLGFSAAWTAIIIFFACLLKKAFSTKPTEIQEWVKQNYKFLDAPHQEVVASFIADVKQEIDSRVKPSVRADIDRCSVTDCSCAVCKNIKIYILQYFRANGHAPNEIDAWVEQNCNHLISDDQFRVASVIESAIIKMQSMVNPDVREILYIFFFDTLFEIYERYGDIGCILRYFRDKNQEIQTWLLRQDKDISNEVLAQVVQRVHEIERLPAYTQGPEALIRELRLKTFINPDPIQSKALSYLTQSNAATYLKFKYKKSWESKKY
jgi:hypothetical protein